MLDATAQRASRRPICCRVWTDEGFYGDGEAGIAFDYAAPAGIGMLQDISRLVIGKDPMRTDELWERMFKVSFWGQGGGPVVFAAISAIDIALMDIKGKVLNVPVYELLGGKVNDSIRCYASQLQFGWNEDVGPRGTAKEYADICKYAMEDGYDAVKLDFTLYDRDKKDIPNRDCEGFVSTDFYNMVEERIVAIREACGNVDIIMENHGRTDVTSGIKLGELCDKYNFYALEEPCTPLRPEFQKLISDPEQKEYVYGDSTTLLGKKFAKSQWAALWIFLGCVAIVAVFGATKGLRPVFGGKAMSMTLIIQMMMLTAGALMVIFCRTRAADVGKSSVFRAGAIAIAAVYGVAWMSDSLFQAHLPELKQALTGAVTSYPWLYAVVLLVVSKFVNSQAAAVAIILPVAVQVGVPTGIAVSMISACYGYYILPTYPSDLAALQFDRSGTTHIGKFVINHSFILPGLIGVITATVVGAILGYLYGWL